MEHWNIYYAESVYTRCEDGMGRKNTRKLEKIASGLNDFRKDCWPVIDAKKQEILSTLRLLGTVREMAGRIKDIDEKAMLGIYGTYNTNIEKFAPYVLN